MGKAIIVPNVDWASKNFGKVSLVELTIIGDTTIYGTMSYSAELRGAPVSVNWSLTGSAATLSSQVGTSVTLTPISDGVVTLSATYEGKTESIEITVYEGVVLTSISGQEWLDETDIVIAAQDGDGNTIPATLSTNDTSLITLIDNGNGTATVKIVPGGTGGTATISASFYGVTVTKNIAVYVMSGLQRHLVGDDAGASSWVDRANNVSFSLANTSKTANGKGVIFNGTSAYGKSNDTTNFAQQTTTIEVVASVAEISDISSFYYGYSSAGANKPSIMHTLYPVSSSLAYTKDCLAIAGVEGPKWKLYWDEHLNVIRTASVSYTRAYVNGTSCENDGTPFKSTTSDAIRYESIGAWRYGSNYITHYLNGSIYQMRIYNRTLSAAEVLANQAADIIRYGIS